MSKPPAGPITASVARAYWRESGSSEPPAECQSLVAISRFAIGPGQRNPEGVSPTPHRAVIGLRHLGPSPLEGPSAEIKPRHIHQHVSKPSA